MNAAFLELKVPPVGVALAAAMGMGLAAALTPSWVRPWGGRLPLTLAVAASGVAMIVAGVLAFRRARTTVNPLTPEAAATVVAAGPYRMSRNPMYVGLLLLLAAWALHLSHPIALLGLPAFVGYMNRFQIAPEERALRAKFGPAYEDYVRSVRRWI